MQVEFNQIEPRNFRIGDVLLGNDGSQYAIVDAEKQMATLRKLRDEERNKPQYTDGRVFIA